MKKKQTNLIKEKEFISYSCHTEYLFRKNNTIEWTKKTGRGKQRWYDCYNFRTFIYMTASHIACVRELLLSVTNGYYWHRGKKEVGPICLICNVQTHTGNRSWLPHKHPVSDWKMDRHTARPAAHTHKAERWIINIHSCVEWWKRDPAVISGWEKVRENLNKCRLPVYDSSLKMKVWLRCFIYLNQLLRKLQTMQKKY